MCKWCSTDQSPKITNFTRKKMEIYPFYKILVVCIYVCIVKYHTTTWKADLSFFFFSIDRYSRTMIEILENFDQIVIFFFFHCQNSNNQPNITKYTVFFWSKIFCVDAYFFKRYCNITLHFDGSVVCCKIQFFPKI